MCGNGNYGKGHQYYGKGHQYYGKGHQYYGKGHQYMVRDISKWYGTSVNGKGHQ